MYKKTIKYTDFNDNEREETFYFNLTETELMKMDLKANGLAEMMRRIIAAENTAEIAAVLEDIILKSYGEKSLDGKRFVKNDEIRDSFAASEAFSNLFMELLQDEKATAEFFNGIVPAKVRGELANMSEEDRAKLLKGETPASLTAVK